MRKLSSWDKSRAVAFQACVPHCHTLLSLDRMMDVGCLRETIGGCRNLKGDFRFRDSHSGFALKCVLRIGQNGPCFYISVLKDI